MGLVQLPLHTLRLVDPQPYKKILIHSSIPLRLQSNIEIAAKHPIFLLVLISYLHFMHGYIKSLIC